MIKSSLTKVSLVLCLGACSVQGVSAQSDAQLVEQLRADYAALLDARLNFEQLETESTSSPSDQADYADWIQQLSEQFAARCRDLADRSPEMIPADIPCAEVNHTYSASAPINIEQEYSDSESASANLDQFNQSLGEFDEKLLREQDRVKASRPQAESQDSGGGAGSDSGSGSGSDGDSDGDPAEGAEDGQQSDQQGNNDGQQTSQQGGAVNDGDNQSPRGSVGSSQSSAPPDTPDGRNDDVIARQLREAAEKESDPELKKKLWAEYKRYKEGL